MPRPRRSTAPARQPTPPEAAAAAGPFRVRESFAVPTGDGVPRAYRQGVLVAADDPIVQTHRAFLVPVSDVVEQATAAPGEVRTLRLPSGVTDQQAAEHRFGHAHTTSPTGETVVPHTLPPEHPDSPASPFAPAQPAAGVVADDVPDEQNKAGKPKAADAEAATAAEASTALAADDEVADESVADLSTESGDGTQTDAD